MSKRINVGPGINLKIPVGQNVINVGPLIRLLGLEKNPKLMNVWPTFIPDPKPWISIYGTAMTR